MGRSELSDEKRLLFLDFLIKKDDQRVINGLKLFNCHMIPHKICAYNVVHESNKKVKCNNFLNETISKSQVTNFKF